MEMAVRIMSIALLAPSQTVLRMKMKYQRASLLCCVNKELSPQTKQNRSLNPASIVGVIMCLDTGWLRG
jgi:hypothetical protein